jgi:hypothetical protein
VHAQKTFSVTCPVISGNVTSGDFQWRHFGSSSSSLLLKCEFVTTSVLLTHMCMKCAQKMCTLSTLCTP